MEELYNKVMPVIGPIIEDVGQILMAGMLIVITIAAIVLSETHGCPSERTRKITGAIMVIISAITLIAAIAVLISHISHII